MSYTVTICGSIISYPDTQEGAEIVARHHSSHSMMPVLVNEPKCGQYEWAATYTDGQLTEQRIGGGYR